MTVRTVLVWRWNPPRTPAAACPRNPRAVRPPRPVEPPIDGDKTPIVRPYYVAYEQQPQPVEVVW
ncbi:hypothetical protein [Streptomyces halobius]|uniref:Uncharacterized protein n=1 Tax=Streptomyces halobius TaxID=2879846 RepID=A0ABY4MAM9_9ACTN|nr:hypothetical protein [Streptomyces halobius]UQA93326.1 hypothetical protein K9S39_17060 [Streptomyces halobius]